MGRYRDTDWYFVSRDAIKRTYTLPGDDEALVERAILTHPYLDIYPPIHPIAWTEYIQRNHALDLPAGSNHERVLGIPNSVGDPETDHQPLP